MCKIVENEKTRLSATAQCLPIGKSLTSLMGRRADPL